MQQTEVRLLTQVFYKNTSQKGSGNIKHIPKTNSDILF